MKDGWFKMFGAADEAFIRFLAKYLKDRVTGHYRVTFLSDRPGRGRPRPEQPGRVEIRLPEGLTISTISGIRYRYFQIVVEIMGHRPLDADGLDYLSPP